jgi:hypothetical protein
MASTLKQDRQPTTPADPRARRIGIYGARGAGKTCYLARLHGRRVADGVSIMLTDDATLVHPGKLWSDIIKHRRLPTATPLGRLDELQMRLDADGSWQLCV